MDTIIGIDPGSVSAAYGVLKMDGGLVEVDDVPVADKMVDAAAFARVVRRWTPKVAIIEHVSAFPKQGVASSFRFGVGTGMLRGVVLSMDIPLYSVSAGLWKRHFKLNADPEKSRSLAISMWPECVGLARKKDHGRAEALLIARWYTETHR